jgi:hypothetical protein
MIRFLLTVFLVGTGGAMCIWYKRITESIGLKIWWAEKYMGEVGTYYAYFIFGLIGITLGLLVMTKVIPLEAFGIYE